MQLKIAVYNMEWMKKLFDRSGPLITTGDKNKRSAQLAEVVKAIDSDILGVGTMRSFEKSKQTQIDKIK
ncbi:MAG: hypothetical protein HQ562_10490 [Candidatus Marinimicrobia bacterium]|nr:hypothetical protein [Candidatus Neomarinimicrobiota bacterium]